MCSFQTLCCIRFRWYCCRDNGQLMIAGSDNGSVSSGNNPLSVPIYKGPWRHMSSLGHNELNESVDSTKSEQVVWKGGKQVAHLHALTRWRTYNKDEVIGSRHLIGHTRSTNSLRTWKTNMWSLFDEVYRQIASLNHSEFIASTNRLKPYTVLIYDEPFIIRLALY